jgi:hypothetical protein
MTCEECAKMGHMGINCLMTCEDTNFVGNSSNGFRPNQGLNLGWNKPNFPFDNHQQGSNGQNFGRNESSLWDIIWDQLRINESISRKFNANDKILESMGAKMDSFSATVQNQLCFNKMLETQIQQIAAALPNRNENSTKDLIQESVKSIHTMLEGALSDPESKGEASNETITGMTGKTGNQPMSEVSSNVILNQSDSHYGGLKLPTIPCVMGILKIHHALYDWGASVSVMPRVVYDCLDEDPPVPTPLSLELSDKTVIKPHGIAKDVLMEIQGSPTLLISLSLT